MSPQRNTLPPASPRSISRHCWLALSLSLLPAAHSFGQGQTEAKPEQAAAKPAAKPEQLDRVEVEGRASDEAQRRASTASKIIIGREEIERFGDSTVGEVLKRLPGVTTGGRPGRGGDIRMRGMGNGYTQILVNGERMPPGFSLDQLPPDQVERIEVLRAPTAEYGARAVAGTINVVLREALQRRLNDWRFGLGEERGLWSSSLGWTRNDKLDDQGGAYNLTLNAQQMKHRDEQNSSALTHNRLSGADSLLTTQGQSEDERRSLNLNLRLQWKLAGGDSLSIQPFLNANKSQSSNVFSQTRTPAFGQPDASGAPKPLNPFEQARIAGDSRFEMLRVNTQWTHRIDDSRLETRAGLGLGRSDSHSLRQEFAAASSTPLRTQDDKSNGQDRSWSLNSKYSQQFENEHSLLVGLEGEGTQRDQTRTCLQNGQACPGLLEFGDDLSAATQRFALYAQDEWSVGKQWSFYAGLRGETIATRSSAANYRVSNRSSVWTPLLHAVWKFDEKSRDQIRASLTRSYRSPQLQDLIARPAINSQYPCPDGQPCGENAVNYADRMGNPNLKPELATGIDVAYERYLSKGGILSASLFYRRISDLIRTDPRLETVSWASVPRWVSSPRNIGKAGTMGLELEAKFRLDEFLPEAWPVSLRSNLSLFRSSVEGIPGPNNRLDQQPRATANLGADYRLRSLPLSLGAGLNWTPAVTIQQSVLSEAHNSRKVVLDAFALWSINPIAQLRLSASNLDPLNYSNGNITTTPEQIITTDSGGRSYTSWQLRLELKI
ncbi:iron complex outermembrane receptor protein [Paucibacter oligotrophus]|uniref:Iron complex outermembrane receptor protein n=1 Tax=Roseateles oligotrophus TaxID=1769250 RepID=A0A840LHJ0_9BURK|nr:TonB-dependent receptor [Roseateles oligotrophus]MBB4846082.1 iron complex outermembrane receptor protein [Roseateles oligotrophus]